MLHDSLQPTMRGLPSFELGRVYCILKRKSQFIQEPDSLRRKVKYQDQPFFLNELLDGQGWGNRWGLRTGLVLLLMYFAQWLYSYGGDQVRLVSSLS